MASQLQTPWTRDADEKPSGLSRTTIVATAMKLADEEGIEAVSIRRLATELEARPMSLYSHIKDKRDLVALMVDGAMAEALLPGAVPADWREALRQIAQGTRTAARNHQWMIAMAFTHPPLGPNTLRHIDQSLAAVAPLPLPFDRKRSVLLAIDTYTLGFVRWEVLSPKASGEYAPRDPDAPSKEQLDAYLREQAASGEYPHLAAIAASDLTLGVKPVSFEAGLEWLLAGIADEVEATEAT